MEADLIQASGHSDADPVSLSRHRGPFTPGGPAACMEPAAGPPFRNFARFPAPMNLYGGPDSNLGDRYRSVSGDPGAFRETATRLSRPPATVHTDSVQGYDHEVNQDDLEESVESEDEHEDEQEEEVDVLARLPEALPAALDAAAQVCSTVYPEGVVLVPATPANDYDISRELRPREQRSYRYLFKESSAVSFHMAKFVAPKPQRHTSACVRDPDL